MAALSVPLRVSQGRGAPALSLDYASGGENGIVGLGFSLNLPSIVRRSALSIPEYTGHDTFLSPDGKMLVPQYDDVDGTWVPAERMEARDGVLYAVVAFRPERIETYSRLEQWTEIATGLSHWRVVDPNNAVARFGVDDETRIADPQDPRRIFRWLIADQVDAHGNQTVYRYRKENDENLPRRLYESGHDNRANRYPDRILYGAYRDNDGIEVFALETRFEYLEAEDGTWAARSDPFSSYRAGFEIRTNRLCTGVSCIHHFPEELGAATLTVGRTHFVYASDAPISLLARIEYTGYRREGTDTIAASLPPAAFEYDPFRPGVGETITLRTAQGEAIPALLDHGPYRLVDLLGDGMPGILYADGTSCSYLQPLGNGEYGGPMRLPSMPIAGFDATQTRLANVTGNGRLDLVVADRASGGWYPNDDNGNWSPYRPFASYPPELANPENDLADVAGTGLNDLLVQTAPPVFFRSLRGDGFAAPAPIVAPQSLPIQNEGEDALVTFADMFGDGLAHRVRISDGNVAVWPNLGNGRFGNVVAIAGAPPIPSTLANARILLADVTGTGPADILLVFDDHVALYANYAGDYFEVPARVPLPFLVSDQDVLTLADVTGDGRMRLVVSKAGVENAHYAVPIAGPGHPYLLVGTENGQGGRTRIAYGSSTTFALRDRREGHPWATNLPKPVLVVTHTQTVDEILGMTHFEDFAYADGYFDGAEREFRGFGFVERRARTVLPLEEPTGQTLTRTWNQTGAYIDEPAIGAAERKRAFHDPQGLTLPSRAFDRAIETGNAVTLRGAYRALGGAEIRSELYGAQSVVPCTVKQSTPFVRLIQPPIDGLRPVFQVIVRETANAAYDPAVTDPAQYDPRINYNATVAVTPYGQPATVANVYYPRRKLPDPAPPEQGIRQITASLQEWIDHPGADWWVMGMAYQSRSFELAGLLDPADRYYTFDECAAQVDAALLHQIDYGSPFGTGPQARRYAWSQKFFWNDERTAALPLGEITARQLLHHERAAAFPLGYVDEVYGNGRVTDAMLSESGGYERDLGHWWKPAGVTTYAGPERFFLPLAQTTPFASTTRVEYDRYALAATQQIDPFGNRSAITTDYQALAPRTIVDINGNVAQALYDPFGRVMVTTLWAEKDGAPAGNAPLDQYQPIWNASADEVLADPARFVQGASSFACYDLGSWKDGIAPRMIAVRRSQWVHGGQPDQPVTEVTVYNATETQIVVKTNLDGEAVGEPAGVWHARDRIVPGPGSTPLRRYLSYLSPTPDFPEPGQPPYARNVLDALDRIVRTDTPKGFYTKSVYTPWTTTQYDQDDTVLSSRYYIEHINDPELPPLERDALEKAVAFSDTPATVELDVQGRDFVQHRITYDGDSGPAMKVLTSLIALDVAGNQTVAIDPRFYAQRFTDPVENVVNLYDMTNTALASKACDTGKDAPGWTRVLGDVLGNVLFSWNNRGFRVARHYVAPGHQIALIVVTDPDGNEWTAETFAYGNDPNANTVEQLIEHRDQGGISSYTAYSLLGEVAESSLQLVAAYAAPVNWSDPIVPLLPEIWRSRVAHDALGRSIEQEQPDGSTVRTAYYQTAWPRSVQTRFAGSSVFTQIAGAITYDALGGRTSITYGNGVVARERYDRLTGSIVAMQAGIPGFPLLQDLAYFYDPAENVTSRSRAPGSSWTYGNAVIDPVSSYTCNPIYQLIGATGFQEQGLRQDTLRPRAPIGDPAALVNYTETYRYDDSGNLLRVQHTTGGADDGWTTGFAVANTSNHSVTAQMAGGQPPDTFFDLDGNLLVLPNLRALTYDPFNHLSSAVLIERIGGENDADYFVYASDANRTRKVARRVRAEHIEVTDTWYLGNVIVEEQRLESGGRVTGKHRATTLRVALGVDILLVSVLSEPAQGPPERTQRYQLADELGSITIELDESAQIITRQEYFPYGGTALLAGRSEIEVETKRYRYNGQEWDASTGLYSYGQRYFVPGLYRWLTPDPLGPSGGINLYQFNDGNPVTHVDPNGTQPWSVLRQRFLQGSGAVLRDARPVTWVQKRTFISDSSERAKATREVAKLIRSGGQALFQDPNCCYNATTDNLVRPEVSQAVKLPTVPVRAPLFKFTLYNRTQKLITPLPSTVNFKKPADIIRALDQFGPLAFTVGNIAEKGSVYTSGFHSVLLLNTIQTFSGGTKIIVLDPDPTPTLSEYFRDLPVAKGLIAETGGDQSRFRSIPLPKLIQLRGYEAMLRSIELEAFLNDAELPTFRDQRGDEIVNDSYPVLRSVNPAARAAIQALLNSKRS